MSAPDKVIPEKCIGHKTEPSTHDVNSRDAIIYALGNKYFFIYVY
jgi:hypothetical protein